MFTCDLEWSDTNLGECWCQLGSERGLVMHSFFSHVARLHVVCSSHVLPCSTMNWLGENMQLLPKPQTLYSHPADGVSTGVDQCVHACTPA